jgi:hypothetical protein
MIYCFDLDGTICDTIGGDYESATPFNDRVNIVNSLYDEGHHIIIETARGSVTGLDWTELTERQLRGWGVKYTELRAGVKFYADFYIDDKAINADEFFK